MLFKKLRGNIDTILIHSSNNITKFTDIKRSLREIDYRIKEINAIGYQLIIGKTCYIDNNTIHFIDPWGNKVELPLTASGERPCWSIVRIPSKHGVGVSLNPSILDHDVNPNPPFGNDYKEQKGHYWYKGAFQILEDSERETISYNYWVKKTNAMMLNNGVY